MTQVDNLNRWCQEAATFYLNTRIVGGCQIYFWVRTASKWNNQLFAFSLFAHEHEQPWQLNAHREHRIHISDAALATHRRRRQRKHQRPPSRAMLDAVIAVAPPHTQIKSWSRASLTRSSSTVDSIKSNWLANPWAMVLPRPSPRFHGPRYHSSDRPLCVMWKSQHPDPSNTTTILIIKSRNGPIC